MHPAAPSLIDILSEALPLGYAFKYHHVSTPPSSCPALYAPPPGHRPEKTTCESHLLNVSVSPSKDFEEDTVAIFAIEVYIYSTRRLTTLFVSKADSTGWVSLLNLPKGFPSIVKTLSSTFVSYLVRNRHRPDRRLVLSLFARAQSQYLYPGSDENNKKHILDDRQLVKWWCRTLDPVLREYEGDEAVTNDEANLHANDTAAEADDDTLAKTRAKAYLIVPGHDRYETLAFFPPSARTDPPTSKRWHFGHPLRDIASHPTAPPRCLVPHFPDDPKSRFLLDLDEEIQDAPPSSRSHATASHSASSQNANAQLSNPQESPSKRGKGQWKSVKTLEQFWDMMAFRQECSSGRLVGFLWVVFTPDTLHDGADTSEQPLSTYPLLAPSPPPTTTKSTKSMTTTQTTTTTTAATRPTPSKRRKLHPRRSKPKLKRAKGRLTGPIVPRAPRIKQPAHLAASASSAHEPGTLVLPPKAYARVHEVLVRLDFATVGVARASTAKWVREAGIVAGRAAGAADWGAEVEGRAAVPVPLAGGAAGAGAGAGAGAVNVMVGVKRKAKDDAAPTNGEGVNVLSVGMVRKKAKPTAPSVESQPEKPLENGTGVTALAAGLVRKKAKS